MKKLIKEPYYISYNEGHTLGTFPGVEFLIRPTWNRGYIWFACSFFFCYAYGYVGINPLRGGMKVGKQWN